jgi:Cu/Ag efflux pump CusA
LYLKCPKGLLSQSSGNLCNPTIMLRMFIERPVLSTVISVILVILGLLGILSLPITLYPDIAPPTVQVSASYQGANADVVMNSVIIPLEEQINGATSRRMPGMMAPQGSRCISSRELILTWLQ